MDRTCTTCGERKALTAENFQRKRTGKGGFDKLCKACKKEYDRQRYLDNQARFRQEKKEYYWKSKAKRKQAEYPAGTGTAK